MKNDQLKRVVVAAGRVDTFDGTTTEKLLHSLTELAALYELTYLLSYHDDGVVWGKFENGGWLFSAGCFDVSPPFGQLTLQTCRAFGKSAELLIWRDLDRVLRASYLVEGSEGEEYPYYDQQQLLWGNKSEEQCEGFSLLAEGAQGLRHAVPLPVELNSNAKNRVALTVRNYIAYDNHQAWVKWSRLAWLEAVPVGQIGRTQ